MSWATMEIENLTRERDEARAEVEKLTIRRDELLATIVRITNETPFADEVAGWMDQRAKMIAEIGTLRSRVSELEDERKRFIIANADLGAMAVEVVLLTAERLGSLIAAELDADDWGKVEVDDFNLEGEYADAMRSALERVVVRIKNGS